MHKPQSKESLRGFIGEKFKLWLPDHSFTPGHSTPFDFVADAFFHPTWHLAAWANRSGLKTLCSSIIAALEYLFAEKPIQGRVLAGSEDQAKNLYRYWEGWCFNTPLGGMLKGEPGRLLTRLSTGNFEILAASQKRVRGGKVQRLYRDEIDEIEPEIYAASVGMLATLPDLPARSIDTSTWHHPMGPMGKLVAEADKRGITLHKWAIWESIAKCPPDRHDGGRNCEACPLGEVCLAKARTINPHAKVGLASQCMGLFAVADAITQIQQWSKQQWEAEAECKRPTLEGTIYPQFDRAIHVRPDLNFSDALPTFRAIDWGLRDFVCLWIQEDKHGNVYIVDEYHAQNVTVADNARAILALERDQCEDGLPPGADDTFADPAGRNRNDQSGRSDFDVLGAMGLPCSYTPNPWAREVKNGISLIRGFLEPAVGAARLFVAGDCHGCRDALESYRQKKVNGIFIDEPVKPQDCDHWVDALRYYFVNRHIRNRVTQRQWSAGG